MQSSSGSGSGWLGPAISVAGSLLGTGLGAMSTGKMNKRGENFARWMYARQRADALADWQMQNEYNSPAAQMQRFKDAGINPQLVASQGTPGAASSVRSSNMPMPKFNPLDFSGLGAAGAGVMMNALQAKQMRANIQRTEAETSAVETSTADKQLSLAVREAVGFDRLVGRAVAENQSATSKERKMVLEAESFIEAIATGRGFDDIDRRANMNFTHKDTALSDSVKAVLQKNVKELELIKQNLVNAGLDASIKQSVSAIKSSEAELYETLKGVGMASQTGQLLYALLRLVLLK